MKSVDPKMLFGFAVLVIIALLAMTIALGKVSQQDSYGLESVITCLSTLAGGFAQWAFQNIKNDKL